MTEILSILNIQLPTTSDERDSDGPTQVCPVNLGARLHRAAYGIGPITRYWTDPSVIWTSIIYLMMWWANISSKNDLSCSQPWKIARFVLLHMQDQYKSTVVPNLKKVTGRSVRINEQGVICRCLVSVSSISWLEHLSSCPLRRCRCWCKSLRASSNGGATQRRQIPPSSLELMIYTTSV